MGKETAREGRTGATYPEVADGHVRAQPNQRLPKLRGQGNARDEYDAYQGKREEEADSSPRKPGQ